jgi:hypothetical protein
MNLLMYLMRGLQMLPMVVAGIEHIHAEAPGATKKQMAMDALGLAYGAASSLVPGEQAAIDAATEFAGNTIDGIVNLFNQTGIFKSGAAPAVPTVVAPVALVPAAVSANLQTSEAPVAAAAPVATKVGD